MPVIVVVLSGLGLLGLLWSRPHSGWVLTTLVCLVTPVAAETELADVVLPVAPKGKPDRPSRSRLIVNLTRDGRVLVDPVNVAFGDKVLAKVRELKPGLTQMTLDQLSEFLRAGKDMHRLQDLRRLARGQKKKDPLTLLFRADKDASSLHVHLVLTICAEQRFQRVEFGVKLRADGAHDKEEGQPPTPPRLGKLGLAFDLRGIDPKKPRTPIRVQIRMSEDRAGEKSEDGHRVYYQVGDKTVTDSSALANEIASVRRKDEAAEWRVEPGDRVKHKYFVAALNALRASGITKYYRAGGRIPGHATRSMRKLP